MERFYPNSNKPREKKNLRLFENTTATVVFGGIPIYVSLNDLKTVQIRFKYSNRMSGTDLKCDQTIEFRSMTLPDNSYLYIRLLKPLYQINDNIYRKTKSITKSIYKRR